MALLYKAELTPTKLELVQAWVRGQPWFETQAGDPATIGAFRFDDPEGEVGIETLLVRWGDGETVAQIPVTYRGAPLEGGESWLIGTTLHSVLGERWVYDATGDPAWVAAIASAAFGGLGEAELVVDDGSGTRIARATTATVRGSGSDPAPVRAPRDGEVSTRNEGSVTVVTAGELRIAVPRTVAAATSGAVEAAVARAGTETVAGTWEGQADPVVLATVWRSEG
jgi:hypothetical protein